MELLLNLRYVRLACVESLIGTAVLYRFLMHKDPHNALIVQSVLLNITNKVQLSFLLGRGCISTKVKTSHMFLLNVKSLFKSIVVHIFILFGRPHCYLDILPPINMFFFKRKLVTGCFFLFMPSSSLNFI